MAYTTPPTYTTGQILTAANLNTYLRDNLRYLKGLDGPVTFSDKIRLGNATIDSQSWQLLGVGVNNGPSGFSVGQDTTHNLVFLWDYNATPGNAVARLETYSGNNSLTLQASGGNVGIGTTAPQGKLHVTQGSGNMLFWSQSGITSSTYTILPNSTISKLAVVFAAVRNDTDGVNGASLPGYATGIVPTSGSVQNLYSSGGEVLGIASSSGNLQVWRVSGTKTYSVALLIMYL